VPGPKTLFGGNLELGKGSLFFYLVLFNQHQSDIGKQRQKKRRRWGVGHGEDYGVWDNLSKKS